MIAQVSVDEDGAVMVLVDTEASDVEPELLGLSLDDLLARASAIAVKTWRDIRTEDPEPGAEDEQ